MRKKRVSSTTNKKNHGKRKHEHDNYDDHPCAHIYVDKSMAVVIKVFWGFVTFNGQSLNTNEVDLTLDKNSKIILQNFDLIDYL